MRFLLVFFSNISEVVEYFANILNILIGYIKDFHKMYIKPYFDKIIRQLFYFISLLRKKCQSFCKWAIFFADSFIGA